MDSSSPDSYSPYTEAVPAYHSEFVLGEEKCAQAIGMSPSGLCTYGLLRALLGLSRDTFELLPIRTIILHASGVL